jgi:GNAT superfamily N-acetyltransferase
MLAAPALVASVFCTVAESEGKAVGMALVIAQDEQNFFLHDVIVLPPYRKKGVATLVIASVVARFARINPDETDVILSLIADPQLQAFYARFGFQPGTEKACMQLRRGQAAQARANDADEYNQLA